MAETFEQERGDEFFPPGTSDHEQREWWLARREFLKKEMREVEVKLAALLS